MRLLADENFPRFAVETLRGDGHDVAWIQEEAVAASDVDVLARAVKEKRVLLTQDKDFGELAFRAQLPADCGVVLFRLPPIPRLVAETAQRLFVSGVVVQNRFLVVEESRVRERPLP